MSETHSFELSQSQIHELEGNARFFAKTGQWTRKEKEKYLIFLLYHHSLFFNSHRTNQSKLFKLMSKFIQTRKTNQCQLYHQKMMKYYQSTSNIIHHLSHHLNADSSSGEEIVPHHEEFVLKQALSEEYHQAATLPNSINDRKQS